MRHEKPSSSGLDRISDTISEALLAQKAALMPYFPLGYPDPDTSLAIIQAIAPFSDLIELGIPFSDPIADGPTIQRSTQRSLQHGITTAACLEMVRKLRDAAVMTPFLMMGYYNPILAYGEVEFVKDAADAGVDGLIVPDLPPEESSVLRTLSATAGLAYISFLAPTSSPQRIELVSEVASGFIYLVSVAGVTGARGNIAEDLRDFVSTIRSKTSLPVAIGFGISSGEQASNIGEFADGVIVGSALIDAVDAGTDKVEAAAEFVSNLKSALTVDSAGMLSTK